MIEVGDGQGAVTRFGERPDDIGLCLFDVMMPKMRGIGASETVRTLRPDVRVLFESGNSAELLDG